MDIQVLSPWREVNMSKYHRLWNDFRRNPILYINNTKNWQYPHSSSPFEEVSFMTYVVPLWDWSFVAGVQAPLGWSPASGGASTCSLSWPSSRQFSPSASAVVSTISFPLTKRCRCSCPVWAELRFWSVAPKHWSRLRLQPRIHLEKTCIVWRFCT